MTANLLASQCDIIVCTLRVLQSKQANNDTFRRVASVSHVGGVRLQNLLGRSQYADLLTKLLHPANFFRQKR